MTEGDGKRTAGMDGGHRRSGDYKLADELMAKGFRGRQCRIPAPRT
jgi:hypothetical protein